MANTIASKVWRDKYRQATLDTILRRALIAEEICDVDRDEVKRIDSPYSGAATAVIQPLSGTYTISNFTTHDDYLTVDYEVIVAEHIYDFERILSRFDLFATRVEEQAFAIKDKIDKFVLNELVDNAGASYTTPPGGFSRPENIPVIFSELLAKVAGYADAYKGLFLVLENTDLPGLIQRQVVSGFSFADTVLKNGYVTSYMGIDIYVTRQGTFFDGTLDNVSALTFTNEGHRVFGVKKVATYAAPRGVHFEEKQVSGKTGVEVVTWGYVGFKLWTPKANLIVDITLAEESS